MELQQVTVYTEDVEQSMKVLRYEKNKKAEILSEALLVLLSGGSVVYPTETAYALGADFFSPHAYRNIYTIKYRHKKKFLPVIVSDLNYARTIVQFSPKTTELALKYWPGPLTLLLPFLYHKQWPHHGNPYLALRVSSNPFAASLAKALGHPIISTSANVSGADPCYNIEEIIEQFKKIHAFPDLIIDAGILPEVPPSTIIQDDGRRIKIIRQGPIEPEKG